MHAGWSSLKARAGNRLARHFLPTPLRLANTKAMVSFTFDDIPDSAARMGAPLVEEHGGRATFYVAGGLVGEASRYWTAVAADEIIALHRNGHEIGCHTFSHPSAVDLNKVVMAAEFERNQRYFTALEPSIRLENFAYPFGLASVAYKRQLKGSFRSSRGILPGVNRGVVDLHYLRAIPLVEELIDGPAIERACDAALASRGWLIFYSHDVAARPSPYGCTPQLLRRALRAALRRDIPIVTVAEALTRAGA
jgi:peptidoglycan/xylan/chitin deacetylase (PgdA/CDA1 family)